MDSPPPFKLLKGPSQGHQTCYHKREKSSLAVIATVLAGTDTGHAPEA